MDLSSPPTHLLGLFGKVYIPYVNGTESATIADTRTNNIVLLMERPASSMVGKRKSRIMTTRGILRVTTILSLMIGKTISLDMKDPSLTRRQLGGGGFLLLVTVQPDPAWAARGAAELDLEFYVRDLIGGNRREGTIPASGMPTAGPPRKLSGRLLPILLMDQEVCTANCAPCRALMELVQRRTGQESVVIAHDIAQRVQDWRDRSSRSFRIRTPWVDVLCVVENRRRPSSRVSRPRRICTTNRSLHL
jgi:hypothetical protein